MQCVIHGSCTVCAHRATHFGQGISCSRKKMSITLKISKLFFYLQAAAYRIEIRLASHFGRQITKKLKAERRLTTRWIHLILVQNNLPSGVLRLVVPSHQLPIHQFKGGKSKGMLFSFFHVLLLPKHRFSHITSYIKLSAIMYGVLV